METFAGSQRQELMLRPVRGATYWLALHGIFFLLSYRSRVHQLRDGTTHSELGPHIPFINEENAPKTCPKANPAGTLY